MAILITDKIDFKAAGITRDERETFHNDRRFNLPGEGNNFKFVWMK